MGSPSEFVTPTELVQIYKITSSAQGARNLAHRGKLPHYKVNGRLLFKKSEVERFIANGRRPSENELAATENQLVTRAQEASK